MLEKLQGCTSLTHI